MTQFQFSISIRSSFRNYESISFIVRDSLSNTIYNSPNLSRLNSENDFIEDEITLNDIQEYTFLLWDNNKQVIIEDFSRKIIPRDQNDIFLLNNNIDFQYAWGIDSIITKNSIISRFRENIRRRKVIHSSQKTDLEYDPNNQERNQNNRQTENDEVNPLSNQITNQAAKIDLFDNSQIDERSLQYERFENDLTTNDLGTEVKISTYSPYRRNTPSMPFIDDTIYSENKETNFGTSNIRIQERLTMEDLSIDTFTASSDFKSSSPNLRISTSVNNRSIIFMEKLQNQIQDQLKEIQSLKRLNQQLNENIETLRSENEVKFSTQKAKHAHEIKSLNDDLERSRNEKQQLELRIEKLLDEERISQGQKFGKMINKNKKEHEKLLNEFEILKEKCTLQQRLLKENEILLRERDTDIRENIERNRSLNELIQNLKRELEIKEKEKQSEIEVKDISISSLQSQFNKQKEELNEKIFQQSRQIENLEQENELNSEKLKVLREENMNLQNRNLEIERQLKNEDMNLSNTYKRLTILQKENEELKNDNKILETELNFTKDTLSQLQNEHENEVKSSLREIQLLKERMDQMKERYNQSLIEQKEKSSARINELATENEVLSKRFQDINSKYEQEVKKKLKLDESKQELKSQNIDLNNQVNELRGQLNQRIKLQQELQESITRLEKEFETKQIESRNNENNLIKEIERLNNELSNFEDKLQSLKIENNTLTTQYEKTKGDILRLKLQDEERQKQLLIQHERIRVLERESLELAEERDIKENLNNEITKLTIQIQELQQNIEQKDRDIILLNSDLNKMNLVLEEKENLLSNLDEEVTSLNKKIENIKAKSTSEKNSLVNRHKKILDQIQQELEKTQNDQMQWLSSFQQPVSKIMKTLGISHLSKLPTQVQNSTDQTLTNTLNANTTIMIHEPKISHVHSLNESDISQNLDDTQSELLIENLEAIVVGSQALKNKNDKLQHQFDEQTIIIQQKNDQIQDYSEQIKELREHLDNRVKEERKLLLNQIEDFQKQIETHKESIEEYESDIETLRRKIEKQEDLIKNERLKHEIEINRKEDIIQDEKTKRINLESELDNMKLTMQEIENRINQVKSEFNATVEEKDNIQKEYFQKTLEITNLQQNHDEELKRQSDKFDTIITNLERDLEFTLEEKRSIKDALDYSESQRKKAIELKEQADIFINELEVKIDNLINEKQEIQKEFEQDKQILYNQINKLNEDLEFQKEILKENENKIVNSESELIKSLQQLDNANIQMNEEKINAERLLKQLEHKFQNQVSFLETELNHKNIQVSTLEKDLQLSYEKCEDLNTELLDSKRIVEENNRYASELETKLEIAHKQVTTLTGEIQESLQTIEEQKKFISSLKMELDTFRNNHLSSLEKYEEICRILDETRESHSKSEENLKQSFQAKIISLEAEHSSKIFKLESDYSINITNIEDKYSQEISLLKKTNSIEIEKLKSKIQILEAEKNQLTETHASLLSNFNDIDERLRLTASSYNETIEALQEKETKCRQLLFKNEKLEEDISQLKLTFTTSAEEKDENIIILRDEIDKLKETLENSNNQNNILVNNYSNLQNEYKATVEKFESDLQSKNEELNFQIQLYEAEKTKIDQLNNIIKEFQFEITQLSNEKQKLNNQINNLQINNQELEEKFKEKLDKIVELESNLTEQEHKGEIQLETLKEELQLLEKNHSNEISQLNELIIELQERISDRQKEIEIIRERAGVAENKYEQIYNDLSQTQIEYKQNKVHMETVYDSLQSEYDNFKEETKLLIESKNEEILGLGNSILILRKKFDQSQEEKLQEILDLQESLNNLNLQYSSSKSELIILHEKLKDSEINYDLFVKGTKERELQITQEQNELKTKLKNSYLQIDELEKIEKEKDQHIESLNTHINELNQEQKQIKIELENMIEHLKEEINIKDNSIKILETEITRLKDVVDINEAKIKRLSTIENQYTEIQEAYEKEQLDHHNSKIELKNYKIKLDDLEQEFSTYKIMQVQTIDSLQIQLEEFNHVKEKNLQLKKEKLELESQVQNLDEELSAKLGEIQFFEEQLKEYEKLKKDQTNIIAEKEELLREYAYLKPQIDTLITERDNALSEANTNRDTINKIKILEKELKLAQNDKEKILQLKKKVKSLKKKSRNAVFRLKDHFEEKIRDMSSNIGAQSANHNDFSRIQQEFEYLKQSFVHNSNLLQHKNNQLTQLLHEREYEIQQLLNERNIYLEKIDELKHSSKLSVQLYKEKIRDLKIAIREKLEDQKDIYENRINQLLQAHNTNEASRSNSNDSTIYEARINNLKNEISNKERELRAAATATQFEVDRVSKKYELQIDALKLQLIELKQRESNETINITLGNKLSHLQEICRIERSRATLLKAENQRLRTEIVNLKSLSEEWIRERKQLEEMIESLEEVNNKLGKHYNNLIAQPQKINDQIIELRTLLQAQEDRAIRAEKLASQHMKKSENLQKRLDDQIRYYDEKGNHNSQLEELEGLVKNLYNAVLPNENAPKLKL